MNDPFYDVTIVGGGPAGSLTAIHLARGGLTVCLVEKETHPRYKVCGGGVLARAATLLPVPLDAVVEQECRRVEMRFWGKKIAFSGERDKPIIYMVMRTNMDDLLIKEVVNCGVKVLENTMAIDLSQERDHVALQTSAGNIRSRFVVAADGVSSIVALKGGWQANPGAIPSMECEVSVDPATLERFSGTARFDLDHPRRGYSWVFPKRDHLSIGVLSMTQQGVNLRESFHEYLESLGIRYSPPLKLRGAMIPVRPRPGKPAGGRILLVGDAAGLAEPICAEGITNSLRSGTLAAKAIMEGDMEPEKVASIFSSDMEKTIYRELGTIGQHAKIMYGNRSLRNILFRFKGQSFCNSLIDVMMGERDLLSFGGPLRQFFS